MTALTLTLEGDVGTSIDQCAEEAVRVATILLVSVKFLFNELVVLARPGESAETVANRYYFEHASRGGGR